MEKTNINHAYDITNLLETYEVEVYTKAQIGHDISYRKLITSVREAEKFNYQSDYWGDADVYQEENVELMEAFESYVGENVSVKFDDEKEKVVFKLLGILIDKKYNSKGHTVILVEEVE